VDAAKQVSKIADAAFGIVAGDSSIECVGGRWFIRMGFAGFNSKANNARGYSTRLIAALAHRTYARSCSCGDCSAKAKAAA
jgi:hypothetical protein